MLNNSYCFYELDNPSTDNEGLRLWSRVERCPPSVRRSSYAAHAEREHIGKIVVKTTMAEKILSFRPFSTVVRRVKNAR